MVKSSGRLISLDIFRGLAVAFMIIVSTPGSWQYIYPPLKHAEWNGCTPADLVFPFFLFIAGISAYYSLKKYGSEINWGSFLRIIRRVLSVFAVGLLLNIFPHFRMDYSTLRIMGVLQRIALAYGLGSVICLIFKREHLWIVIGVILLLYWALMSLFGATDPYSLAGNFALKTDIALLGKSHLYNGFGRPFEPDGLLGTLTATCTFIIGYFIGEMLGTGTPGGKTVLKLILFGVAAAGLGYLWNIIFPINKPLWTSSYVLYSAGIAIGVLAIIYLIADVLKLEVLGTPFSVFGTNALFAYLISSVLTRILLLAQIHSGLQKISFYDWFYAKVCVPVAGNLNGSLMFGVIQMLLIWGLSLILYRKKVLIRL